MAWSIFTSAGNKLKEVARRSPYRAGSSAAFRLPGGDTAANASRRGPNCGPGSRYVHTGNADGRSPNLDGRAAWLEYRHWLHPHTTAQQHRATDYAHRHFSTQQNTHQHHHPNSNGKCHPPTPSHRRRHPQPPSEDITPGAPISCPTYSSFEEGDYLQTASQELSAAQWLDTGSDTGPAGLAPEIWDVYVRPEVRVLPPKHAAAAGHTLSF
ncbi:MAG: hypothetical protein H6661_07365 [Ardenticatenaceae bacterium]|nr:hypothetical protein [Ardenticatenaceae bacterium]